MSEMLPPNSSENMSNPEGQSFALAERISQLAPTELLAYLQHTCTPDMLLADRPAQAQVRHLLNTKFYHDSQIRTERDRQVTIGRTRNPDPVIKLKGSSGGEYEYDSFLLAEPPHHKHRYYVPDFELLDTVPPFLRPEDIVPPGYTYKTVTTEGFERLRADYSLTKEEALFYTEEPDYLDERYKGLVEPLYKRTLHRIPFYGGDEELYNYALGQWETTGNTYDPGIRRQIAGHLQTVLRPLLSMRSAEFADSSQQ